MDEIDIPSHFICPISLQLMRDPVIVATGITYDRESIEKWLFSSQNNTCPITKQVISVTDLTPNHNLRRLIQSWCMVNASHGVERIPTPKLPVDKTQIAKIINDAKKFPSMQVKYLRRIRSIAFESERNIKFLEEAGAIDFLASTIKNDETHEAISILYHIGDSGNGFKNLMTKDEEFMESLMHVLKSGTCQSRAYAVMLLKSAFSAADPAQMISVKLELFTEIVNALRDKISDQASKASLKVLMELCPWGRNRIKAVEAGAISVLIELLIDESQKRVCEAIIIVLDQLCGCAEGRSELLNHGAGLAIISKKILRVSHVVSDRAVRVLCSICRQVASSWVLHEMLQVGVVSKLCLVLQVDSSSKTKERAREILKLHSRVWKNSPCIPPHLLSSYPSC